MPVLRNDKITQSLKYDELIIKYGNKLAEKYTSPHNHDMIRANLRYLGRFKIEMMSLDDTIIELKEILKPIFYDKCVKAIRKVASWDDCVQWYKHPQVAITISSLIKKIAKKQRTEYIKQENEEKKKEVENFLLLWEEDVATDINKKALEDQANQKRVKQVVLPTKDDINKLYVYLKEKIENGVSVLQQKFVLPSWIELVKSTLIFIQIFNRRRAGEIERLTVSNYKNKERITDNMEKELMLNLSKESLTFAKQFIKISLRGKLGRTVSVLLSPLGVKAVDLILKYRSIAGISEDNVYIFSKHSASEHSKQYYSACALLREYSNECGAKIPESLRGTKLRKHIATFMSIINAEDAAVDRLANFMGHHKDIHKNIYRMNIPAAEITCISKILMAAIGNDEDAAIDEGDADDDDYPAMEDNHFEVSEPTQVDVESDSESDQTDKTSPPKVKRRSSK